MTDLSMRPAGYEVVRTCLERQAAKRPRTRLDRILGSRPVHPSARSWFDGAVGEIEVGRVLAGLGDDWRTLHSVPVGRGESDIDHVVIGPGGVFAINTKRHNGQKVWVGDRRILVAGQKTDHLRNSRYEAGRATKALQSATGIPVSVSAALVLVDTASITIRSRPDDVAVLTPSQVATWIARRPQQLSEEEVGRLIEAARLPRTWHASADGAHDATVMSTFAALRALDDRARLVRIAWSLALALAVVAVCGSIALSSLGA